MANRAAQAPPAGRAHRPGLAHHIVRRERTRSPARGNDRRGPEQFFPANNHAGDRRGGPPARDYHGEDRRGPPPAPRGDHGHPARPPRQAAPQRQRQPPILPENWNDSGDYFDMNTVYGLTFPRLVSDTPHSRQLGYDRRAIEDIRLVEVINMGMNNWMLRHLAHGRYCAWEAFRSKK